MARQNAAVAAPCSGSLAWQLMGTRDGTHPEGALRRLDEITEQEWTVLAELHPRVRESARLIVEVEGGGWLCTRCGAVASEPILGGLEPDEP